MKAANLKFKLLSFVCQRQWSQAITLSHIDKVENGSDEGGDNTHHNHHSNATLPSGTLKKWKRNSSLAAIIFEWDLTYTSK